MENKKVTVISTVNNLVSVKYPGLNFAREWPAQGSAVKIEYDVLEQLMYQAGFKYMIDQGILYIEDMDTKKELSIEPEDAEEPENIIVLNDADRHKYLGVYDFKTFKEKVAKLSREQILQLADYAIAHKMTDYDKCKFMKEICGKDIIRAIELSDLDKEE